MWGLSVVSGPHRQCTGLSGGCRGLPPTSWQGAERRGAQGSSARSRHTASVIRVCRAAPVLFAVLGCPAAPSLMASFFASTQGCVPMFWGCLPACDQDDPQSQIGSAILSCPRVLCWGMNLHVGQGERGPRPQGTSALFPTSPATPSVLTLRASALLSSRLELWPGHRAYSCCHCAQSPFIYKCQASNLNGWRFPKELSQLRLKLTSSELWRQCL